VKGEVSGALKIDANKIKHKSGTYNLKIPENETHSSGHSTSLGIDSGGGFSISHHRQKDDVHYGIGYSGTLGGSGDRAFGNNIQLFYKNKDAILDVNYSHPNTEKIKQIWTNSKSSKKQEKSKILELKEIENENIHPKNPKDVVVEWSNKSKPKTGGSGGGGGSSGKPDRHP